MEFLILFLTRLLELKKALIYLPNKLKADHNKENKSDGKKLERIMLNENEWNLMKDLVKILEKFEIVTKLLGGSNYITISLVYPMILSLKNHIKEMLDCYQDNQMMKILIY